MAKKGKQSRLAELFEFLAYLADNSRYEDMPYHEYLHSYQWKMIRENKLTEADYRCQVCNSPKSLHVHHRTYERYGRERLSDLTVLCKKCHTLFHEHSELTK